MCNESTVFEDLLCYLWIIVKMHPMAVIQHKASIHDLMEETLLVWDRLDPVIMVAKQLKAA